MARSMWRGAISFGMVAIPVRMYVATEAHSAVSFRQLCPHCQLPIKQQRHCPTDDHVVGFGDVLKGYEVGKNQFVIMDDEDLDKLPLKTTRTIDIVEFVERNEVPLGLYIKSAYYLEPEDVGVKPFYLLKRALEDTNKVAVAKVALRDREHLCLIQVEGNTLLCNTLNWPDEIRSTEELNLPQNVKINEKEVKMATSLIENLSDRFQPERYTDDYKAAFQQIVDQKMQGLKVTTAAPVQETKVMDLMAALKASVEATRKGEKAAAKEAAARPAARAAKVKVAAKTSSARPAARRRTA
jgi:DNA end-binding protein Ku